MLSRCLKILTKFCLFVKKNFWLFSLGFLVISLSFSFGFIIGANIVSRPPFVIEKELIMDISKDISKTDLESSLPFKESRGEGLFVASSRGKYYYPADCSLAKNLSEKNKIYFKTREEAESRGYIYNTRCD